MVKYVECIAQTIPRNRAKPKIVMCKQRTCRRYVVGVLLIHKNRCWCCFVLYSLVDAKEEIITIIIRALELKKGRMRWGKSCFFNWIIYIYLHNNMLLGSQVALWIWTVKNILFQCVMYIFNAMSAAQSNKYHMWIYINMSRRLGAGRISRALGFALLK